MRRRALDLDLPWVRVAASVVDLGLPPRATAFWCLLTATAIVVLVALIPRAVRDPQWLGTAVLFTGAAAAAEYFEVRMPSSRPGAQVYVTISGAVFVAVCLLLPPHWAVLCASFGLGAAQIVRRRAWFKVVFNVASYTHAVALASFVWQQGGGHVGFGAPPSVLWALGAAFAFFVATSFFNSGIISLVLNSPLQLTWARSFRHALPAMLGELFVGIPVAGLWLTYPWMVVCVVVPLVALHRALNDRVALESQTLDSLFELADILDERDKYTHGHSERVGHYAEQVAIQLGLPAERAHVTFLAGRLHDIGKCAIKNEVLLKPAALDEEEQEHMRQHPEVGSAMLAHLSLFREVARFVRGHHERWDGGGYPDRLKGEGIPLESRIIAVVDSFDAMTTTRPYRAALSEAEARRRLLEGVGRQWDARVVSAFMRWLDSSAPTRPALARPASRLATATSSE